MPESALYPRLAQPVLVETLADSPVVLIHGPRQCGKTTLAQVVGNPMGYAYISFDDDVARAAADGWLRGRSPATRDHGRSAARASAVCCVEGGG